MYNTKISTEWDGQQRVLYETFCKWCKTTIWLPKHRLYQRFCGRLCSSLAQQNQVKLQCCNCGIDIEKAQSRLRSKHKKFFCSRKCKELAQSLTGTCPEIRPPHYGTGRGEHRYRSRVDIDHCVDCGDKRFWTLIVHHVDGNRKNNHVENLEVVCRNCHSKRHLLNVNGVWMYNTSSLTPREMLLVL